MCRFTTCFSAIKSKYTINHSNYYIFICLSKGGNVLVWGANRKGQLGNGQLTSICNPEKIPQLRHRPVIAIACGENHSMCLTIGGSIYTWGDNSMGQLGTGDTTSRLRPELLRSMRAAGARSISAGGQHSMVISSQSLLFAFGSNSTGLTKYIYS